MNTWIAVKNAECYITKPKKPFENKKETWSSPNLTQTINTIYFSKQNPLKQKEKPDQKLIQINFNQYSANL